MLTVSESRMMYQSFGVFSAGKSFRLMFDAYELSESLFTTYVWYIKNISMLLCIVLHYSYIRVDLNLKNPRAQKIL